MSIIDQLAEEISNNKKLKEEEKKAILNFIALQTTFAEAGYVFSLEYTDKKAAKAGERPDITIKDIKSGKRYDLVKILEFLCSVYAKNRDGILWN